MHGHAINWYDVATYVGFCAMLLLTSLDVRRAARQQASRKLRAALWACAGAGLMLAGSVCFRLAGGEDSLLPTAAAKASVFATWAGLAAAVIGVHLKRHLPRARG